ncbi:MAG TPA: helix-turn-helix transcriptional regulator [Thermoanaerobaculia bacterium]|nr:helix-turn-helix transcriptional regulator [Thermoanaerobaculia bacterium]
MSEKLSTYREFVKSVRSSIGYWKSYSLLQFTLAITRVMRLDKVSGRKLAARLGISAAQVSKVLQGNENITIETMAKFADALGAAVHIHVAKKGVHVQWQELSEGEPSRLEAVPLKPQAEGSAIRPTYAVLSPPSSNANLLTVH